MRNKCRICGYRFKSNDEEICPECFTAREDDISCNSYSDDVHNHNDNYYTERTRFDNTTYNVNETFDEGGSTFVENERRDEKHNSFANKAQQQATGNTNNTFQSQPPNTTRSTYSSPNQNTGNTIPFNFNSNSNANTNRNTSTNNTNFYRTNTGYQFKTVSQNNFNRKSNSGAKVFGIIIFLIIAISFISGIISDYEDNKYYDDYTYSYEVPEITEDDFTFKSSYDSQTQTADDNSYNIVQNEYYGTPTYSANFTEAQQNSVINGLIDFEEWYDLTLNYTLNNYTSEMPCKITNITLTSLDENDSIIAQSTPYYCTLPMVDVTSTGSVYTNILCPNGAAKTIVSVEVSNQDGLVTYDFTIDF